MQGESAPDPQDEGQDYVPVPRQGSGRTPSSKRSGSRAAKHASDHPTIDAFQSSVGMSRFTILLAIVGTSLSAFAVMLYALIVVLKVIWHAFTDSSFEIDGAKHLVVELIELADFFLFGMVLYVVAIGMYQLFVNPDIPVPDWMRVHSLDDLKTQLINVIAVLLAVSFLAVAVSWTNDRSILYFGIAIAVVILALAAYNVAHHRIAHASDQEAGTHEREPRH
ncbi:MAG: YqhA family protein [Thermomicrobiales bacterium]